MSDAVRRALRTVSALVPVVMIGILVVLSGCAAPADPDDVIPPTPEERRDPEPFIEQARAAIEIDDYAGASQALRQALEADPESVTAHFMLATSYVQQGMLIEAEASLTEVLRLDPDHADAWANLGVVYYRMGRMDEAEETLRTALSKQPDDAELHYNLGGVLLAMSDIDGAQSAFFQAVELDPILPEPYLGLGSVYAAQEMPDEAIEALNRYIELSDDAEWRQYAGEMIRQIEEEQ